MCLCFTCLLAGVLYQNGAAALSKKKMHVGQKVPIGMAALKVKGCVATTPCGSWYIPVSCFKSLAPSPIDPILSCKDG